MKAQVTSFWEWQQRYCNDDTCLAELAKLRWPGGFQCPHCGHDHGWLLSSRSVYECSQCHRQCSVTAGTLFHASKVSLTKWFWAIYWVSSDKGSVSALRLTKLLGLSWRTANKMLRKLRTAMGHQDSLYRLHGVIELDDALVGGKRAGKRGRGAAGKTPILVACEHNDGKPGFVAIQAVTSITHETVNHFADRHLDLGQRVHTDALPALNSLTESQHQMAKVTPPAQAYEWLLWVHVVISNFKTFILGTYHGVSGQYLQEDLNEYSYRLNRRFWEPEIPNRFFDSPFDINLSFFQPEYCS